MLRKTTSKIIIHCSATDKVNTRIADIRRWQTAADFPGGALPDVAYHYFICGDGLLEVGLPEASRGYHTEGQNNCSVGICLNGPTKEKLWPNPEQIHTLESILVHLNNTYPGCTLHGHKEFRLDKLCPAFDMFSIKRFWDKLPR